MPPRSLRHDLRVMRLVSCALIALLPALSTHAQTSAPVKIPAPTASSASATPAAKAPAPAPVTAPPKTAATAPAIVKVPASISVPAKPASPPAPTKAPALPAKPVFTTPPVVKVPGTAPAKTTPSALKPSIAAAALSPAEDVKRTFKDKIVPFVKTYCYECHGDRRMKGGVTFHPALKNPSDPAYIRRWKMGLATVHAHDMPPDDADAQPPDAEREAFMAWVGRLKYLSPKDPGAFVIRRLTKVEYGNTLHDLLGVSPDIVQELPDEVPGEGYMNTLSPLQMEQYLSISNDALSRAFAPPGAPPTPVQQRLLGPMPAPGTDPKTAARATARTLARSAYRRPATEHELDVLMQVFDLATRSQRTYPEALLLMLKALLVSPQFLYITPATEAPAGSEIVALDDWMLASRLSYFLWATMPDAQLATLADQGKLRDPAVLQAQTKRLLQDPRSRALFDGFGAQWLGLADLADKTFDTTLFPQMTPALRQAMYDEARLFFDSIVRENRPVTTFITADYTYLNESLAALYALGPKSPAKAKSPTDPKSPATSPSSNSSSPGSPTTNTSATNSTNSSPANSAVTNSINSSAVTNTSVTQTPATPPSPHSLAKNTPTASSPASPIAVAPARLPVILSSIVLPLTTSVPDATPAAITGSKLRRVTLTDPNRGGILGMPGILATTSFPNRTSPVKRGVWVLEQILGQHVPPAPPNVPTLEKQDKKKIANLTLRQRTELHRTNVVCANCHKILDPIGFGLENFDAIGRWRTQEDTGGPIDAAGELPGGKHFSTPAELKAIIAARKNDLSRNLTEKLLAYALCRQLEGYDEIVIDQLMTGIAKDNHRMQSLITAVVTSYPFLNRRIVETLSAPAAKK